MECVHLIIGGKKINPVTCGADMRYRAPRTAIGTKNGRYAYYVSRDRHYRRSNLGPAGKASGWDNAIMMGFEVGSTCFHGCGRGGHRRGRAGDPVLPRLKLKNEQTDEPKGEKANGRDQRLFQGEGRRQKLSANFTMKEFACRDGSDAVLTAPRLVMVLQSIRSHFAAPVVIHSAYRTPQYNAKVGGAAHSQHCYGTAADISVRGQTPAAVAAYARELMPDWGGGVPPDRAYPH